MRNSNDDFEMQEQNPDEYEISPNPDTHLGDRLEDVEHQSIGSEGFGIEAITPTFHCNFVSDIVLDPSGMIENFPKQREQILPINSPEDNLLDNLEDYDYERNIHELADKSTPTEKRNSSNKTTEATESTPTSANISTPMSSPKKMNKNLNFEEAFFDEPRPLTSIKYSPHIYRKDSLTKRAIRSMSFLVKSYFISQMKKSGDFVAQRKVTSSISGQEIKQIISDSEIQEKGKVKRRSKGYSMKEFKSDSALFRQFVEEHLESFADELFDQYDCPMSTENKRILFSVVSHLIKGKSNFKKYINSGQKSKYNIGRRDSSKIFEAAKDFFAYNSRNSGLSSGRSFSLCSPVISLAKVLLERDEKNYDIVFKKLLGRKNMEVDDPEKLKRKVLETLDLTI
uniref:Uncharacterized protein n=1 Tax=Euplotes crassus TaxID=5936 RepID=A0A7S3NU69_EUPCR|mmetsp:Transcript_22044/g.21793  ORF Transcript_22044/g.21793 Transcript_22044/m.21793 type:complete len:397 (+) Transcript_22044:116-1306(+)